MRDLRSGLAAVWVLRGRHARPLRPLERRPIGTNGYVSTWGAIIGIRPPEGC
jgi:hypothetical protein